MGEQWVKDLEFVKTTWAKPYLNSAPYLILVFKQVYGLQEDGSKKTHYYNEMSVCISVGLLLAAIQVKYQNIWSWAVHVSHIYNHLFIFYGYITNSQYDQLPVGLIAQLVGALHRHHRGHGFESHSEAWIFRLSFPNCLKSCVLTARIFLLFDLSSAVQNICFLYS